MQKFIKLLGSLLLLSTVVSCGGGNNSNSNNKPNQTQSIFVAESAQIRTPVSAHTVMNTDKNKLVSNYSLLDTNPSNSSCIQLYQYPTGDYYTTSISAGSGWSTASVTVGITNVCNVAESFIATINYNNVLMNNAVLPSSGYNLTESGPLYLTVLGSSVGGGEDVSVTLSTPSCSSGCGWNQLQPGDTQFITNQIGYSGLINSLTVGGVSLDVTESGSSPSSNGTLSLILDASQAGQACPDATSCNFVVNVISPSNVVVATESINPAVNSQLTYNINNLLPGQYSVSAVSSSIPTNVSVSYLPSATISVASGTTVSESVSFNYIPAANNVSVDLGSLPSGFSNNIVLGRILSSSGTVVQNLQFTESSPSDAISSVSLLSGSTYTLQIQGLGNPATGVYYAPIIESFTIVESNTNIAVSYAPPMTSGLYTVNVSIESQLTGQTVSFGSDNDYYNYAINPLIAGSYVFPSNDMVNATASVVSGYRTSVSPNPLIISSSLAGQTIQVSNQPSNSYKVVGYVDGTAIGAFATIPCSAFASYDMIIIGFSNCTANNINCASNADSALLSMFQTASSCMKPNSILSLSVGGENGSASFNTAADMTTLGASLANSVAWLNSQITTPIKITGVDLDIEVSGSEVNITPLAQALQSQGLLVSIAPMASATTSVVDPNSPSNFVLTGGGTSNDYAAAVAAGYVDYINLQAYNSGPGTIQVNGTNEGMPSFHQNIAAVMNTLVSPSCGSLTSGVYSNGYPVCIPASTVFFIGTVANSIAGGTYTMWESEVQTAEGNAVILNAFNASVQAAKQLPHYGGVMVWSLGNDYDPSAWSDTWDPVGAFTNNIPNFGF